MKTFADSFVWGAASASYQIEGAPAEDGKGLSVWDMFCRKPGAVLQGQSGDVACDHYHRYREDVSLMQWMGLDAYRFSISWPRILPAGIGPVNPAGLAFYDSLVDSLLEAHITPYVTLFHWDFPYVLYCRGGWLNPDSPLWFAEYTEKVVDLLSDRVRHWMTLNEPQCFIGLGLQTGIHAPGDQLDMKEVLLAAHHALLAHGRAVRVIRSRSKTPSQIGFAPVGSVVMPVDESPENIEIARQETFRVQRPDLFNNSWFSDPVFFGHYPEDGLAHYGQAAPELGSDDMKIISQPLDFYGANIYQGTRVRRDENGEPEFVPYPEGYPHTQYQWPVSPEVLYWGPRFLWERYGKPIYITENGMANLDWVSMDGKVHDPQRIDYIARHLLALHRAYEEGVPVGGYFHWSMTDNFEWAEGYRLRFGLIHIDYQSQRRMVKDSAHWYKSVIESNGGTLVSD